MKKRKRPTPEDLKGNSKLTEFVLRKALTIPSSAIIKRINEGHTQSMIAREFGTSRSAVSQRIKSLVARKLLTLTPPTGSGKQSGYDVHLGSIKWPLTKPIKLPFDAKGKNQTLTWQEWRVKGHRIRLNEHIEGGTSLEIFGRRVENFETIEEAENSWMDDCKKLYAWLGAHYPALKEVSREHNYTINRSGKLTIHALKGTAEAALKARGGGQIILDNVGMIDDSKKNGGEFHIFLSFFKNLATKNDIKLLQDAVMLLGERQQETNQLLKTIIETQGGKKPKEPEPPPELDKNDPMFR